MISYYSASKVYSLDGPVLENGVIAVDGQGNILQLYTAEGAKGLEGVKFYEGAIVPGFVNTHCHLELSHLKDKIPQHTGLVGFIKGILANRSKPENQSEEVIQASMNLADQGMFEKGIVAVGDISNDLTSKITKQNSKIHYHTFIELFGFNKSAEPIMEQGIALQEKFKPLPSTLVAHAPYSVNPELLKLIYSHPNTGSKELDQTSIFSIHNQETLAESQLFINGHGEFAEFLNDNKIGFLPTEGSGNNSLKYHLPYAVSNAPLLLVHNTFTTEKDINYALEIHPNLYWAVCAKANLYIENNLPDISLFRRKNLKICIGTDSLASNQDLDILAELRVLQQYFNIPFEELLTWACRYGAEFLGLADKLGSLAVGKRPGLVWIKDFDGETITEDSSSIRLI